MGAFFKLMTSRGQCPRGGACECPRVGAFFKLMTSRGQCPRGGWGAPGVPPIQVQTPPHLAGLLRAWGLTPQQQPGSSQGGEMMMMKSVFWWRKPEYAEETTDLRQVTDATLYTYGLCPVRAGIELGPQRCEAKCLRYGPITL